MVTSMTGYGRAQQLIDGREITVELKSVNHRYFEFSARVPRAMGYLEEKLKSFFYSKVARGKVDVGVTVITLEGAPAQVEINRPLAQSYVDALRELSGPLKLEDDLALSDLSRFSDIFVVRKAEVDEEVIWAAVRQVAAQALEKFMEMRRVEGERLKEDLAGRLAAIADCVAKVEERSPQVVEQYRTRLLAKLTEVLGDNTADPQRVLTEAAIFAEKTAVAEETVRLASHMDQMRQILAGGGAIGRKLDFLVQEMNREANTIGSKAQDVEIQHTVVALKSEIEKMREQIQNIE